MTGPAPATSYDIEHLLLVWGGLLPGGETWSCSLRIAEQAPLFGSPTVPSNEVVGEWLAAEVKAAVLAYHVRPGTKISTWAKLSFAKLNRISTDGKYMDELTNQYTFADVPGGSGGTGMPNQNTVAVSLTTGFSRGYAHRGRFFLPAPSVSIDPGTGLFGGSEAVAIRDSTRTFLEAIADVPGIDGPSSVTPTVMSKNRFGGAHRKITGVEVGRVVDTQRRRRRNLKEDYQRVALDLGAA